MSLFPRRPNGYYDERGRWQRTKLCFVDCRERCTCRPPFDLWYNPLHDKHKEDESSKESASKDSQ